MGKRERANGIVKSHVLWSMGGGLIPIPLADLAAVTALQVSMLEQLADLYGVTYSRSIGKSFVAALTGSTAAKLGASLVKALPGIGTLIGGVAMSATSGASTYAVGQVGINYFENARSLEDVDVEEARAAYKEAFEEGKEVVVTMEEEEQAAADEPKTPEDVLQALDKLGELRDKGVLTDEEFAAQKQKLLDRL